MLTRRRFLKGATLGAAGSLTFGSAGLASAKSLPGLHRITLDLPQLPQRWNGLTILQISDVHAGMYMPVDRMRRICSYISSLPADLIVFTGDQIDRRNIDAGLFAEGFRGLSAPLGVYGILGNHDHYIDPSLAEAALAGAGITPLVNDSVSFERDGQRLVLAGVEDLWAGSGRSPDFGILRGHGDAFRVCLCHQPQGWHRARRYGADLTLSGHTHGGQIALPTRNLNVARLSTRYVAGPYRRHDSLLYVSRGIGVGAVPLRVGSPPEVDVITLQRPAAKARAAA